MSRFIPFSVVIPFYHDDENFNRFFGKNYQIIKQIHPQNEILIVDDTGNQFAENKEKISAYDIQLIRHRKNKGFSQSVNDGVYKASYEIVYIFNSDLILKEDSFLHALDHFNDPEVFAVTLKSVYPDGTFREGAKKLIRKSGLPKMKHSPKDFLPPDAKGRIPSAYPVGGHCVVRKSIYQELGGLDGRTFEPFYWEDADLGYRAWKRGWKIIYEPKAVVIHPPEHSSIKNNYEWEYIRFIRWQNRIFFALKNYTSLIDRVFIRIGLMLRFIPGCFKKGFVRSWNETFGLISKFRMKMDSDIH
jgi:GT2 family glycosyltransferase